ncbi:recombinase family protein [Paeniglutamicibacter sp. NPDC091659]|uniref:recombinase family protein n=1 Tax=Paeniglutamicibacter sp. NPDC091659 TaxID=3364389 RepID=UPI0037FBE8DD
MPQVIGYARVSTGKQDLDNQRYEIDRYCEKSGLVLTEFVEEVVSGFKTTIGDRKISQLLDGLGRGDTLIVSETSRISRRLIDVLNTIQICLDRGVTIIAVKESYVFRDDINSKVMAFAFGLAAEIERSLISARTKEALARKKAEGVVLGRPVGSFQHKHYKLHGKDEEIVALLQKQVSVSALARVFNVNRKTMQTYIADNNLRDNSPI